MGKFSEGILGKFSGAIGTVVGSTWRGISYMRSRGARTKTGTPSQAAVSTVVATAPLALPAIVASIAGYLAVAGGVMSAVSQLTVNTVKLDIGTNY